MYQVLGLPLLVTSQVWLGHVALLASVVSKSEPLLVEAGTINMLTQSRLSMAFSAELILSILKRLRPMSPHSSSFPSGN